MRTLATSLVAALLIASSAYAEIPLSNLQWSIETLVDNDDAPFGLAQGPGAGEPRSVRGLALSPDGKFLYLGYNQHQQVRKIDLSVSDPADSCDTVAELHFDGFGPDGICTVGGYTGTCLPDSFPPFDNPKAVATDDVGRVYVTRSSEIQVYDADLTTLLLRITGFSAANGVHAARKDASNVFVYAADRGLPEVYRMVVADAAIAGGGAVTRASVLDPAFDGDGIVNVGLDSAGNASDDLRGLASDGDGNVWVAENDGTLFKIAPAAGDGASTVTKRALASAFDVAIDGDQVFVTSSGRTVTVVDRTDISTVLAVLTPPVAGLGLAATGSATGIDVVPGTALYAAIEGGSSSPQSAESSFSNVNCDGPDPNPTADDDNDPVLAALPCPTTRYVETGGDDTDNDCRDTGAPCATIQHAVDVACPSGDTIEVGAGTYDEQIAITTPTDLTINGNGAVVRPSSLVSDTTQGSPCSNGTGTAIVLVSGVTGVALNDLNVDGTLIKPMPARFVGVYYRNASGSITGGSVAEIRNDPLNGAQNGLGILVQASAPTVATVDVDGVTVSGYQKNGVTFNGCGCADTPDGIATGSLSNSTVTGAGDTPVIAQNGVQVGFGAGPVLITGNTVTGHRYTGNPANGTGSGVLLFSSKDNAITGNVVTDGNNGIVFQGGSFGLCVAGDTTGNVATCNRISGHDTFAYEVGVSSDAAANLVHENSIVGNTTGVDGTTISSGSLDAEDNWWGAVDGPSDAGGSGATGSGDPVTVNVDFDPFATAVPACVNCTADAQCDDGLTCDGAETCNVGTNMCEAGTPPDCSSLDDQCNAGICVEPTGCEPDPVVDGTGCNATLDSCSLPDTCQAGVCTDGGGGDTDGDNTCDASDNCPADFNPGQEDLDGDGLGDVCDPDDGPLNVTLVTLRRAKTGKQNGSVKVKGDYITVALGDAFTAADGITMTVEDSLGFVTTYTWPTAECVTKSSGRVKCKSLDRRFLGTFKPFKKTPGVFRYVVRFKKLATAPDLVFAGPVTARLAYGPAPIDRVGDISDCRATSSGLKCRAF
jgi:Periplasmic copper-binding protein (NosD)